MLVLIVIAAVVVIAAVFFLAMGRGGGMSAERNDYHPLDLGPVSATDVALLRPPSAVWGYNMQATDAALELIAESIRERDVRIVALEQLVTDLSRDHAPTVPVGAPYMGARHRRPPAEAPDALNAAANFNPGPMVPSIGQAAVVDVPVSGAPETTRPPFFPGQQPGADVPGPLPEESHE